ncbi:Cna B-type domain-containing protein [Oribacterium parvum]|uniref:Cna B-type domain-containing protein n=1 Tax=Oribacterium parvum TaxID=1501329 RepID=UPI0028F14465|nr:Cna B-type domain-containing protein [Oribacterium parvum]
MKAKRQILSLLLALVMVWQGFSFANAAGSNQDGISIVNEDAVEVSSTTEKNSVDAVKAETAENGSHEEVERVAEEANAATEEEDDFDDLAMLEELSKNFSEEDLNALIAASATEVAGAPKAIDGVLSNYKLTIDGVDVQDGTTIPSYKNLQFQADIKINSTTEIKEGDYILIKLPNVLKSESSTFSIPGTDDTGKPINLANGIYDAKNKEIKIIFTKEVKKYTSTSGNVYFVASIDKSALKESTKNAPFQITVNNETAINYTVNYEVTNRDNPVSFWKASGSKMFLVTDKKGITHYLIQYKITIDERNVIRVAGSSNFKNVQLVDELRSPELSYFDPTKSDLTESDIKTYSPTMQKGHWYSVNWVNDQWKNATTDDENSPDRGSSWKLRKPDNPNEDAEPNPWNPTYADDGKSFTYTIGDLNPRDGYTFVYYAEINDTPKTKAYKNLARLVGDSNIQHNLKVRDSFVNIEGGILNGLNTYTIQIKKTDDSVPGQPLKGAEFTLKKIGSSYTKTAKTDDHGIINFDGLLYAEYELKETKAPDGYDILNDDSIPITTDDLTNPDNVDKTFVVKVTNKKKDDPQPETVAFSVEKKWVVDAANPATIPATIEVYLKKNGVKDLTQKLELSATNNWKASFSNLPKKDAQGNAINYGIEEVTVEGFNVGIAGDAANGFTVTNSQKPTVPPTPTTPATPSEIPPTPTTPATPSEIPPTPTTPSTPSEIPPTPTTPSTPSEIPPVTPGGNTPRTPGGGGNTPNNPGGGGNTPNPPTPPSEHPGEVLAANRTPEGNVLGAERPAVLGVGRGYTKTEDSRNIWMNLALFAVAGLGFCTSLSVGRKKRSSR